MSYKKFSIIIVSIVVAIFASNVLLWQTVTKHVFFESETGHGDLRRLASYYIPDPVTLPKDYKGRHIEFADYIKYLRDNNVNPASAEAIINFYGSSNDTSVNTASHITSGTTNISDNPAKSNKLYQHFDIITIGDSFTNGGGSNYYQDYMAERYGLSILNIPMSFLPDGNALSLLYVLIRDGYIAAWQPKAIIIGTAEHYANGRYGEEMVTVPTGHLVIQSDDSASVGYLTDVYKAESQLAPTLMVRSNIELIKNKLSYLLSGDDLQLSPAVARHPLTQELFSQKTEGDVLYFIQEDLRYLTEPPNATMINDNFNTAAIALQKVLPNCQLIFTPSVDKLDLYMPYLMTPEILLTANKNSSQLENPFFPQLAAAPKHYVFIDTRSILRELLTNGEHDVYWNDDTHYSWKAQEAVADKIIHFILP